MGLALPQAAPELFASLGRRAAPKQQRQHEQHRKQHKQDLGDSTCRRDNPAEAKHTSDQRDNQEENSPVQHCSNVLSASVLAGYVSQISDIDNFTRAAGCAHGVLGGFSLRPAAGSAEGPSGPSDMRSAQAQKCRSESYPGPASSLRNGGVSSPVRLASHSDARPRLSRLRFDPAKYSGPSAASPCQL